MRGPRFIGHLAEPDPFLLVIYALTSELVPNKRQKRLPKKSFYLIKRSANESTGANNKK